MLFLRCSLHFFIDILGAGGCLAHQIRSLSLLGLHDLLGFGFGVLTRLCGHTGIFQPFMDLLLPVFQHPDQGLVHPGTQDQEQDTERDDLYKEIS